MPVDPLSATQIGAAAGSGGLTALLISMFNKWIEGRKYEKLDDKVDALTERTVRVETEVQSMDARQMLMSGVLTEIQKDQKEMLRHLTTLAQKFEDRE